jgi:hypothetical protein
MGDHRQFIMIDEVVAAYLDLSEQSAHKQFKIWNIAFDGLKEMGLDFFYTVRSLKLPINANLTVNLPADYLNYTKIGVFNDRSEVIPLYYNSKLTFFADLQTDRTQDTEDNTLDNLFTGVNGVFGSFIFSNFWDDGLFGPLYGVPSGMPFVGSFKIDNNAGVIVLSEGFQYPYIVLEYIASPTPKQGTYFLPFQFKEALIAYIGWKDTQFMSSRSHVHNDNKAQLRKDYFNERRLARARYQPFQIEQAYEENLRNMRLTVKA